MEESKKKKNHWIIILLLLLSILCMSVGYSILSTKLNINGSSKIETLNWDVHFDNIRVSDGSVTAIKKPSIVGAITIRYNVTLPAPGSYYEFLVDVKNEGTLDAKLSETPILTGVSTEQKEYINYTVTYKNGSRIRSNDTLSVGTTKTLKVRIEYEKDISIEQLPSTDQILNLTYSMNFVQY